MIFYPVLFGLFVVALGLMLTFGGHNPSCTSARWTRRYRCPGCNIKEQITIEEPLVLKHEIYPEVGFTKDEYEWFGYAETDRLIARLKEILEPLVCYKCGSKATRRITVSTAIKPVCDEHYEAHRAYLERRALEVSG